MTACIVIRRADGHPLVRGDTTSSKVARLAADPDNEAVPLDDPRAPALAAALRPQPRQPRRSLAEILIDKGVIGQADLDAPRGG